MELADPSDQSDAHDSSGPTSASRSAGVRSLESVSPFGARVACVRTTAPDRERARQCAATHFVDPDDDFSALDEGSLVGE